MNIYWRNLKGKILNWKLIWFPSFLPFLYPYNNILTEIYYAKKLQNKILSLWPWLLYLTLFSFFSWTGKWNQSRILVPNRCFLWLKLSWVNYKIIINISESVPRNYASISITSVYKQNQFSLNMLILPRLIIKAFPMPD